MVFDGLVEGVVEAENQVGGAKGSNTREGKWGSFNFGREHLRRGRERAE